MTVVTLSLALDTDGNAAFDDAPEIEVARILTELSAKILGGRTGDFPLRDVDGNRVGSASFSIYKHEAWA